MLLPNFFALTWRCLHPWIRNSRECTLSALSNAYIQRPLRSWQLYYHLTFPSYTGYFDVVERENKGTWLVLHSPIVPQRPSLPLPNISFNGFNRNRPLHLYPTLVLFPCTWNGGGVWNWTCIGVLDTDVGQSSRRRRLFLRSGHQIH